MITESMAKHIDLWPLDRLTGVDAGPDLQEVGIRCSGTCGFSATIDCSAVTLRCRPTSSV